MANEVEYEIYEGDDLVAGCFGPDDKALAEAARYAAIYGRDGVPIKVYRVTRTLIEETGE